MMTLACFCPAKSPSRADAVCQVDRIRRVRHVDAQLQCLASFCFLLFGGLLASSATSAEQVDYLRDVKPILKAKCFSCHGALKQESGLRLDAGPLIRQGGDSGAAIAVGKPAESLLIEKVSAHDEAERMPPEGEPLTVQQIAVLTAWIEQGARSPADERPEEDPREHWAFKKPMRPDLPEVENAARVANPIDAFIAAEHEQRGLVPLQRAEKQILLRRVYLDLIGLPPTREELHALLADDSPDAYESVVDRLLESKHYGERWGRHWMDVWRYSDWYGRRQVGDVRNSYPHIWRWRDWIINSLNDDKGYDQMVREMLAADELYPTDDSRMPALGFIVRNWFSLNYDTWKQDLVEHTGKAFLGLRLNCAHCHDHKYDPITQEEYFRFRAFFEPLEFRHDRVPGGPALAKYMRYGPGSGASLKPIEAGLPRVYDLYPDEKTFMYRLGDTRDRLDRPPVSAAAPAILGGANLPIEQVDLPAAAWYPGLKSFVQRDEMQKRQAAVKSAKDALAKATSAIEPLKQQLAQAEQHLAEAEKKVTDTPKAQPRSTDNLIAWWRFEGADDANGFLADASANEHTLRRITGTEPPAAPFALASSGATKAFLKSLPSDEVDNKQAAEFQQDRSFAYVAASGSPKFYANTFALEAFVHFDVARRNFNRTIADYEGGWTLLHRGLDEKTFELRLRYFNSTGQIRDVATASSTADMETNEKLILNTAHDYYVCLVMGEHSVTLWAADLTTRSPLQSFQFARSTGDQDFSKLARPADDTPFKIGNSDGTGRVDGLIDEVRYTRTGLSLQQIAAAVGQSTSTAVQQAAVKAAEMKRKLGSSQLGLVAAETQLAAAQTELKAIQARVAADKARYEGPEKDAAELAKAAAMVERDAKLATNRAKLSQAEKLLADNRDADKPDAKRMKQAEQDAAAARKAIAALETPPNETPSEYTPLGPEYPKTSTGRRRALADWIGNRDNPLPARVAVNHIWMRHFGRPLVESVFDFGRSGKKPTHPELLDWLAVELMDHDWSMKHVHRLIVTSNTYQLSSRPGVTDHPNFAIDKDNASWWKFERRRLEAEIIRDSMLHVSGQLDPALGGPEIQSSEELTSNRRSLYFTVYPEAGGAMRFMTLFDPPDPTDCYRRTDSIVPQQALAMSNSVLSLNQGRRLADKLSKELAQADAEDNEFIIASFEQVLCRKPSAEERDVCGAFLTKQRELYQEAGAEQLKISASKGSVAAATNPAQRARESLVRTLLNHNDFITVH
jgi:mono/diheme cytochrome c family protein